MNEKVHDVTAQAVVEFTRNLFKTLAESYRGDCTLNGLRVMNQIIRCHLDGRTCSVTALHKVTGIPIPTVSRSVANFQRDGWLSDRPDLWGANYYSSHNYERFPSLVIYFDLVTMIR